MKKGLPAILTGSSSVRPVKMERPIGGKVGMSVGTWLGSFGYWGRIILGTWR
jgi:hypothetical protein